MWLFTKTFFVSIVEKPSDYRQNTLTLRARVASDLDALRVEYLPELGPTQVSERSDYRYRAVAPRDAAARAIFQAVQDIDYESFKDIVFWTQGHERVHAYHAVWSKMLRLQQDSRPSTP